MKKMLPPEVRMGRIKHGAFASQDSMGMAGAFRVRRRNSLGKVVSYTIISGDGRHLDGLPLPRWEHVSVSRDDGMIPTWNDMCWVKDLFWGPDECVVQFHPPESIRVNLHPAVLHLWKPVEFEIPTPPVEYV